MLSDTLFPVVSLNIWGLSLWIRAPAKVKSDGGPWTQFQRVCGGFPRPASHYGVPAGCPKLYLNSATTYLGTELDSPGKGLSPIRLPCTSETCGKHRLLPVLLTERLQTGHPQDPLQLRVSIASTGCYLYFRPTS